MNFIKTTYLVLAILVTCSCTDPPRERYFQFQTKSKVYYENDTVCVLLDNPLKCPVRYFITSPDSAVNKRLSDFKLVILQNIRDSVLRLAGDSSDVKKISIREILGDYNKKIAKKEISLPFPKGHRYRIIQGYDGRTHNDNFSRFSIDFGLAQGDTVCAADDGYVVGVIKDYKEGGGDKRWIDYANFITIYHPQSGLFSQYVHLSHLGSFVAIGDSVVKGQPIGLSGKTGWTDIEHLHFNVFSSVPTNEGSVSEKVLFSEGYDGNKLKRNDWVRK